MTGQNEELEINNFEQSDQIDQMSQPDQIEQAEKVERNAKDDAARYAETIMLGNVEVESNTPKGLVRFVPITDKKGDNAYIVLNSMKSALYLKQYTTKYPSGKTFTSFTMKVKGASETETDTNTDENSADRNYIVDFMNSLKSTLLDQLRGYVKLPDVEDQTEYNFSVRYSNSEDSKFFNVLGYQNKVYTLKRDVFSNVLRNVKQNYVLYLDGIRITSTKVYLVMMYCRSVVTDEIIDQVKYRSAKLQIAEIVNKDAQKSIKKLKYAGYVDLNRRYMKTDRIVSSIKNIAANKYHIGV